jgi:GR25 family glycosyltransferase involved in LPS biosynthesis
MLPIFYINLDADTARRASLEDSVRRNAPADVRLTRIPAFNAEQARAKGFAGAIRDAEKGCFLSHVKAIERSLAEPGPVVILEDDTLIGPRTLPLTEALIAASQPSVDILFLDVCIAGMHDMLNMFFFRKTLIKEGRVEFLDISRMEFSTSSAYVVMDHAKAKLARLMSEARTLDKPYDLWLRRHVNEGRLKAYAAFPYLATLSPHATDSRIQLEAARLNNLIWDSFRRLMFIDFEQNESNPVAGIEQLPAELFDRSAECFSQVLKLALTDVFYATQPPMRLPTGGRPRAVGRGP